jgi:hypothetical protein
LATSALAKAVFLKQRKVERAEATRDIPPAKNALQGLRLIPSQTSSYTTRGITSSMLLL